MVRRIFGTLSVYLLVCLLCTTVTIALRSHHSPFTSYKGISGDDHSEHVTRAVPVQLIRGGYGKPKSGLVRRTLLTLQKLVSPFLPAKIKKFLGMSSTGKDLPRYGKKKVLKGDKRTNIEKPLVTSTTSSNRIKQEMEAFLSDPPDNCRLIVGTNMRSWEVEITGVNGTLYAGEVYRLKMNFPKDYPAKPPSVYFLKPCPKHVHVYSNGDICLNFLGRDWRPTMSAQMLAASILSMLSSAKEKKIPQDNALHADSSPGQQQNWMYHDDRC